MKTRLFLAALLASALLSAPALGIGIGPGRIELIFAPNMEQDLGFYVSNQGERNMTVDLYASGELGKYVTMETNKAVIPGKMVKNFNFHLKLPAILEPGKRTAAIGATETEPPAGMVSALAGVEMQLWIYVSYPENYVSVMITHTSPELNKPVHFNVTLFNPLNKTMHAAADLQILDANNTALERFDLGGADISTGESRTFQTQWLPPKGGQYNAVARAYYGKDTTRTEMGFVSPLPVSLPAPTPPQEVIKEAIKNPTQSPYTLLIVLLMAAIVAVAVWPTKR